ncbi:hypothetical protein ACIQXU_16525 [Peribacillus sp. NPDC097284]|uniref:hypothetical protein n=1 Tax=Peribacillus sp. NPDC097284 TaxID=3364401 RepID=UPI0037F3019E
MKKFLKFGCLPIVVLIVVIIIIAMKSDSDFRKEKEAKKITVEEYEKRVNQALTEMGDKTRLKILSSEEIEKNKYAIALSETIVIFLEINENKKIDKATVSVDPSVKLTNKKDFDIAFELLIGSADNDLTLGERTKLRRALGLYSEETFNKKTVQVKNSNEITFTFKGDPSSIFILEAKY